MDELEESILTEPIEGVKSMPAHAWCEYIREKRKESHNKEVIVITLIGKDHPNRKKAEELNDYLSLDVFPSFYQSESKLDADIFFSRKEKIVFILIHAMNDLEKVQETFVEGSSEKNFYEKIASLDDKFIHSLHIAALLSHIMIIMDPYPRIDMAMVRALKNVNKIRMAVQEDVIELFESKMGLFPEQDEMIIRILSEEGRMCIPRFLFAFQKTQIRNELGMTKKKEITERLEVALEEQANHVFQINKLINSKLNSLGQICNDSKYVRLLVPCLANETMLSTLLDLMLEKEKVDPEDDTEADEGVEEEEEEEIPISLLSLENIEGTEQFPQKQCHSLYQKEEPTSNAFRKLINQNISALRRSLNEDFKLPSLFTVQQAISLLSEKMPSVIDEFVNKIAHREVNFLAEKTERIIEAAIEKYAFNMEKKHFYVNKEKERSLSKLQHTERLATAVKYLDGTIIGLRDQAMTELRTKCDNLWQGARQYCEQDSVTGNPCHLPAHPIVGDESVPENECVMHENNITYISTCICGRSQTIRRDPFSVKEANFDFYHKNPAFVCCKSLEKHHFRLVDAIYHESIEETWHAEENWPKLEEVEPREFFPRRILTRTRNDSNDDSDIEVEIDQTPSTSDSEQKMSSESDEDYKEYVDSDSENEYAGARREYTSKKMPTKEPVDKRTNTIQEYFKKIKRLEEKNIPHTVGVPHSLAPGVLPVFNSWNLTSIGSGSIYNHAHGLRDQPNFKISSEYLLPVDISLVVDRESWEQDLEFVNAVEGSVPKYRAPRRPGIDTEKVKLFIGFDYECSRGHRFFVNSSGEPLLLPKNHSIKEVACRDAATNIMTADLPLRRQCTCRKLPNQIAQLMKVHIVTPKAPVNITIDPKIFLPDQKGFFCTGEAPLKLDWARYYILQLPFIYSGPNGLWIPPKSFDNVGIYKGNSIQVSYTPLGKKINAS